MTTPHLHELAPYMTDHQRGLWKTYEHLKAEWHAAQTQEDRAWGVYLLTPNDQLFEAYRQASARRKAAYDEMGTALDRLDATVNRVATPDRSSDPIREGNPL